MKLLILFFCVIAATLAQNRTNTVVIDDSQGLPSLVVQNGRNLLNEILNDTISPSNHNIIAAMSKFFNDADPQMRWMIVFQDKSHGAIPPKYVVYQFDRSNTRLLVAGYDRC